MWFAELFGKATARRIKYNEYDARPFHDGDQWYSIPAKDAVSSVYDPVENIEEIVVDALNIGLTFMPT